MSFETLTWEEKEIYKFAIFQEELGRLRVEKNRRMRLENQIINFKEQINPNTRNSKH